MGAAGLVTACAAGAMLYLGANESLGQLDPEEQPLVFRIHSVSGPLEDLLVDGKQPKVVEQSSKSGWKYELVIEEGEFEVSWINQGAPLKLRFEAQKSIEPAWAVEPRVSVVVRERQGSKWDESLFDPLPTEGVVRSGNYQTDNLLLVIRSVHRFDGFFTDNRKPRLLQPDERPLLFGISSITPLDDLLVNGRRPRVVSASEALGDDSMFLAERTNHRWYEIAVEEGDFVVSWTQGGSPFSIKLNARKLRAPIEEGDLDVSLSVLRRSIYSENAGRVVPLPTQGVIPPGNYYTDDFVFWVRRGFPIIDLTRK